MLTDQKRDELRRIQDQFLRENPSLADDFKLTPQGPSIKQIREMLFPEWERQFRNALNEV